jgi:hypothetical protein
MAPKRAQPRLALVEWLDAHSPSATLDVTEDALEGVHGPLTILTVGWVLRSDAVGVTIGSEACIDTDQTQSYRSTTFVPRALVVAERPLGRPRTRKDGQPDLPTPEHS